MGNEILCVKGWWGNSAKGHLSATVNSPLHIHYLFLPANNLLMAISLQRLPTSFLKVNRASAVSHPLRRSTVLLLAPPSLLVNNMDLWVWFDYVLKPYSRKICNLQWFKLPFDLMDNLFLIHNSRQFTCDLEKLIDDPQQSNACAFSRRLSFDSREAICPKSGTSCSLPIG